MRHGFWRSDLRGIQTRVKAEGAEGISAEPFQAAARHALLLAPAE